MSPGICEPCRNGQHEQCMDIKRQKDADTGKIPGMHPNVSMWCYCQHKPPILTAIQVGDTLHLHAEGEIHSTEATLTIYDPPQPAGD